MGKRKLGLCASSELTSMSTVAGPRLNDLSNELSLLNSYYVTLGFLMPNIAFRLTNAQFKNVLPIQYSTNNKLDSKFWRSFKTKLFTPPQGYTKKDFIFFRVLPVLNWYPNEFSCVFAEAQWVKNTKNISDSLKAHYLTLSEYLKIEVLSCRKIK